MENSNTHFVYQQPAIEFVTVAVQLCIYLEQLAEQEKRELVDKMLTFLPLLYLKARLVPRNEQEMDGYVEQFVTEEEYEDIEVDIIHAPDELYDEEYEIESCLELEEEE